MPSVKMGRSLFEFDNMCSESANNEDYLLVFLSTGFLGLPIWPGGVVSHTTHKPQQFTTYITSLHLL